MKSSQSWWTTLQLPALKLSFRPQPVQPQMRWKTWSRLPIRYQWANKYSKSTRKSTVYWTYPCKLNLGVSRIWISLSGRWTMYLGRSWRMKVKVGEIGSSTKVLTFQRANWNKWWNNKIMKRAWAFSNQATKSTLARTRETTIWNSRLEVTIRGKKIGKGKWEGAQQKRAHRKEGKRQALAKCHSFQALTRAILFIACGKARLHRREITEYRQWTAPLWWAIESKVSTPQRRRHSSRSVSRGETCTTHSYSKAITTNTIGSRKAAGAPSTDRDTTNFRESLPPETSRIVSQNRPRRSSWKIRTSCTHWVD